MQMGGTTSLRTMPCSEAATDKAAHGCGASRYSALDAKATYQLAMVLKGKLESMSCNPDGPLGMDPDIAQAIGLPSNAMYSMWGTLSGLLAALWQAAD